MIILLGVLIIRYILAYIHVHSIKARKVFDDGAESLPGLIPSRHLQQQ